jgi:HEXXH motif-containing protein
MNKLHNLILSTTQNPASPAWFPELTEVLANYGWQQLYEKYGLQAVNYSTDAVLNNGVDDKPNKTAISLEPSTKALHPINVYPVPNKIASMYADSGAKPYSTETLQNSTVLQCLQEALDILAEIPSVYETMSKLVGSLHVLQPEDDEFDISFSLPNIPFSIFISVPSKRMENDTLRVAEAILHEAMHLQLTLIEQCVPLIIETEEKYFSPWKNEYRHPRGVLHAIYVFHVIKQFFEILIEKRISDSYKRHLFIRCNLISTQLKEMTEFLSSPNFTEAGKCLSEYLFDAKKFN